MLCLSAGRQPKRKTVSLDKLDSKILHDYVDGKTELPSYVKLPMVAGAAYAPVYLERQPSTWNAFPSLACLLRNQTIKYAPFDVMNRQAYIKVHFETNGEEGALIVLWNLAFTLQISQVPKTWSGKRTDY